MTTDKKLLLTEAQVAEHLQVSKAALRKWRKEGRGPRFIKLEGRLIRYRASEVEAFLQAAAASGASEPPAADVPRLRSLTSS